MCIFKEGVNLVNIYDVVLKLLVVKIRNDFITDGVQADGKGILIEVIELSVVRQVLKTLTMLVREVPLVGQRHELNRWMLLHIVLCMLCQHRVGLTSASATLYDDGVVVLICVIVKFFRPVS